MTLQAISIPGQTQLADQANNVINPPDQETMEALLSILWQIARLQVALNASGEMRVTGAVVLSTSNMTTIKADHAGYSAAYDTPGFMNIPAQAQLNLITV